MSTLAFALAATIKHDGHGGVADLLATPADAAAWLEQHQNQLIEILGRPLADHARRSAPRAPAAAADHPGRATPAATAPSGRATPAATAPSGRVTAAADPSGRVTAAAHASVLRVGGDGELDARLHDELVGIRRAVRAMFARAVAPAAPSRADAHLLMDVGAAVGMINQAAGRLGSQRLVWERDGEPGVAWHANTADPVELVVAAVGRSAIEFLSGPDRVRLRACPAARCVKYFLQDDPRQMWCSASCGNRERVNRHYRKRQSG
ncbi:CGNR zinc finger domain-containing protein [Kribbella sp. NPDC000426]|uniref:CGNR zinc finger domain-containing protein n=1 Tax=Kribbella sp. NPDC000426 TaxID=3154255 RepID=UPI0033215723